MFGPGPLRRKSISPGNVGEQGKSGLVMLNVSFAARDPKVTFRAQTPCGVYGASCGQIILGIWALPAANCIS